MVLDPLECVVRLSKRRPEIFRGSDRVTGIDGVVPRIGASITIYGLAVLRQFEMMGVFAANDEAISRAAASCSLRRLLPA